MLPLPGTQSVEDVYLEFSDSDDVVDTLQWRVFLDTLCEQELECTLFELTAERIKQYCLQPVNCVIENRIIAISDDVNFLICDADAQLERVWAVRHDSLVIDYIETNDPTGEFYPPLTFFDSGEFIVYEDRVINICIESIMTKKAELLKDEEEERQFDGGTDDNINE